MSEGVSKTWGFVLNNYTPEEEQQLKDLECKYIVFGHEVGEEKKTPHLQGHVVFTKAYRLSGLKKLNTRINWKLTIGEEFSANYCMKDKDYFLKDNRKQGKRTDLEEAVTELYKNGIEGVKKEFPVEYIKFHNGFHKLAMKPQTKRMFKPEVIWIWGPTGCGKSRYVFEKEEDIWPSGKNLKWWDGYENQEATVFDDFRADFCTFHELLRILDRYPYNVEVKGGSRQLNSKRMYITSCFPPDQVYETREDIHQLIRRIDKIIKFE